MMPVIKVGPMVAQLHITIKTGAIKENVINGLVLSDPRLIDLQNLRMQFGVVDQWCSRDH